MTDLTVAVTGPTGTFGFGLMPLLQDDRGSRRIVGIARRPFDPAEHGWTKMAYRQGDVRDPDALEQAFAGADVVVHLAFMITGNASRDTIRAINVEGTLNAFRAAAAAGAKRFVYASSVAAYGFHRDNPVGMTEEWPVRPGRPPVLRAGEGGDRAAARRGGGRAPRARPLPAAPADRARPARRRAPRSPARAARGRSARGLAGSSAARPSRCPCSPRRCRCSSSTRTTSGRRSCCASSAPAPPGAYNITGDGVLTGARGGARARPAPVPIPAALVQRAARAVAGVPTAGFAPPATEWVEALSHPAIMDAGKAKRELGWTPRYTSAEALRDTLKSR